jgi:two-component system nitrate/nitrite response regulator NarL
VPEPQITVAVADGQPLFRDAVCRVVRQCSALRLVGEAADGRAALDVLRRGGPDVVVADPELPKLEGQRLLAYVAGAQLRTRVIFVGGGLESDAAYELVAQGAAGCLTRSTSAGELRRAVMAVAVGGSFLAMTVQDAIVGEIRLRAEDPRPRLSEREHEVLRRIADGESAPSIGLAMHLSVATVKTHLGHLYDKLGVSERAAAVAVAMRRGLLD